MLVSQQNNETCINNLEIDIPEKYIIWSIECRFIRVFRYYNLIIWQVNESEKLLHQMMTD